jgi:predicted GNAT superfamily acetyltransferase
MASLRAFEERDLADVLALNAAEVDVLAPMDEERLREIHALADLFVVAELDGEFAGFVVTIGPGTAYDSDNYRWFAERYGDGFYYLDRVALTTATRRRGVGSAVYELAEDAARAHGRIALEVRQEPPNVVSLAFHEGRGYAPVGLHGEPGHRNTMLVKELVDG